MRSTSFVDPANWLAEQWAFCCALQCSTNEWLKTRTRASVVRQRANVAHVSSSAQSLSPASHSRCYLSLLSFSLFNTCAPVKAKIKWTSCLLQLLLLLYFLGGKKTTRNKNKSVITFLVRNYAAPCNEIESVRALSPMTRSRAATQAMPAVLKLKVK